MLFPEDCNFLSVGLRQLRARARRLGLLPARCAHASSQTVQRQWQAIARVVSESSKISNHADCQRLLGTSVRVPRRQAPRRRAGGAAECASPTAASSPAARAGSAGGAAGGGACRESYNKHAARVTAASPLRESSKSVT